MTSQNVNSSSSLWPPVPESRQASVSPAKETSCEKKDSKKCKHSDGGSGSEIIDQEPTTSFFTTQILGLRKESADDNIIIYDIIIANKNAFEPTLLTRDSPMTSEQLDSPSPPRPPSRELRLTSLSLDSGKGKSSDGFSGSGRRDRKPITQRSLTQLIELEGEHANDKIDTAEKDAFKPMLLTQDSSMTTQNVRSQISLSPPFEEGRLATLSPGESTDRDSKGR